MSDILLLLAAGRCLIIVGGLGVDVEQLVSCFFCKGNMFLWKGRTLHPESLPFSSSSDDNFEAEIHEEFLDVLLNSFCSRSGHIFKNC